ncbi:MAG: glutathione S-transferase family protein [Burkholderiales bacterium]
MGMLIQGRWSDAEAPPADGRFKRPESSFRNRITADGSSGFPAQAGRYHLYVSYSCPWAHRTIIFRAIKGLEGMISMSVAQPNDRKQGWRFGDGFPGATRDEVNGFTWMHEAYAAADPGYTGRVTVPTLWDRETRSIVNNESSEIIRMLGTEFDALGATPGDYYPEALRTEIDAINEVVYRDFNNGVYRTGFATSQDAYDEAVTRVFACLDMLDRRLAGQRYLVGNTLTEADWRLFVTLVRFDAVYQHLFKCSVRSLASYRHLDGYVRDLYQVPGVAATVRLDHIVTGYYSSGRGNPNGIIPALPAIDFSRPHERAALAAVRGGA